MKIVREVDDAIAAYRRLLAGGSQLVHAKRHRRLLRKLEAQRKGGRASRVHVTKVAAEICTALCEEWFSKKK
jgi:hypothetical protein